MGARNHGFSILELLITLALLGVVGAKAAMVLTSASESAQSDSSALVLDDHAQYVLDRIALSIMGCERQSLDPGIPAGVHTSDLTYRRSLGVDETEQVIWDDTENIALSLGPRVMWRRAVAEPDETSLVLSRHVADLLEGELPNGVDDNGNGLIDEEGLHFLIDGDSVIIRLSVRLPDRDGRLIQRTLETRATCRN